MNSPSDAATSIDRHYLSGDERGIRRKEKSGTSDIERRTASFEKRSSDDFLLKLRVGDAISGPHHGARSNRIDADLRAEFSRERARQHDESRFGYAVDRVAPQRAHAVNVDDVEYETVRESQRGRRSLRQKQRRLQIGAEQVIPLSFRDFADWCRIKRGSVVDQDIESAESLLSKLRELAEMSSVEKVCGDAGRAGRAFRVELGDERLGFFGRALVVHDNRCARAVKYPSHFGADATGSSRDQRHFAGEWLVRSNWVRGIRVAHGLRL